MKTRNLLIIFLIIYAILMAFFDIGALISITFT